MKYTKAELKIQSGNKGSDSIHIYKGEGSFDGGWIANVMGRHVGPVDDDERLGNAKLFIKAGQMFEALEDQIELEKVDCTYVNSAITKERHQIRLGELELLIKEIE